MILAHLFVLLVQFIYRSMPLCFRLNVSFNLNPSPITQMQIVSTAFCYPV